jgi:hypothetical protein
VTETLDYVPGRFKVVRHRKAVAKLADIGRSAADIDDHRVLDAG